MIKPILTSMAPEELAKLPVDTRRRLTEMAERLLEVNENLRAHYSEPCVNLIAFAADVFNMASLIANCVTKNDEAKALYFCAMLAGSVVNVEEVITMLSGKPRRHVHKDIESMADSARVEV